MQSKIYRQIKSVRKSSRRKSVRKSSRRKSVRKSRRRKSVRKSRRRKSARKSRRRKSVRKSRRRKTPVVKLSFGDILNTKQTEGNIYMNNIDVASITSIDLWMVRFIIKCNKWYVVGILSPTNVRDIESLINEYKKYLDGGEKDKNGLEQKILSFLRLMNFSQPKVKFGMMAAPLEIKSKNIKPTEFKRQVSGSVNSIDKLATDIFDDENLSERYRSLMEEEPVTSESLDSRLKSMMSIGEIEKYERKKEMVEVLNDIGLIGTQQNQEMTKIQDTINMMSGSVQQILSGQQQTLSVVNTLSSSLTATRSSVSQMVKNGIMVATITAIKVGLKATVFGFIGLPWMGAKGLASFAMTGGYNLFKPFIVLLSIMFFFMQLGNVFYVMTIPTIDFYKPDQYSVVLSKYPLIGKSSNRITLIDTFSRDISNVDRVLDLSMIEYKHQTEAGKILSNMTSFSRIYHQSGPLPRLVYNEIALVKRRGLLYYFRGYHILIDIAKNYKRAMKGYERIVQDITSSGALVETFTTASYQTQIELWSKCNDMAGNILGKWTCGSKPIKNTDAFDKTDKTQKNYLKWKNCNDYNSKLNIVTRNLYWQDCGKKPLVYQPLHDFVIHNPETLWKTVYKKLSLWLSEEEIEKLMESM